jgi:FkbM family methyltransferase
MTLPEFVYEVVLKPKPLRAMTDAALRGVCPRRKRLGSAWWIPNPNDPVISGGAALGLYERRETAFFNQICKPGMTFLDVGANTGYYSARAISLMRGSGRIIALEPDPDARRYLESTREANNCSFMSIAPVAASDCEGISQLYKNEHNGGDNRLYANDLGSTSVTVQCEPVDSVLRSLGVRAVDLIKMDVQGFEGRVLSGMTNTLKGSPNVTLLMEFWPWGLEQAGSKAGDVLQMLGSLGFSLFELMKGGLLRPIGDHQSFIERLPGPVHSNIVGFRKSASERAPMVMA